MAVTAAQLEVALTATGVPQTEAAVKRVEKAGTQAQSRFASASFQLASSLETMARSGHVMGDSLKQVIFQASNMAFLFGVGGPIVAAAGVAAAAVVNIFTRAREEMKKTREAFDREFRQIEKSRDAEAAARRANELLFGDIASDDPNRRLGVQGLRRRAEEIRAELLRITGRDVTTQNVTAAIAAARAAQGAALLRGEGAEAEVAGRVAKLLADWRDTTNQLTEYSHELQRAIEQTNRLGAAEADLEQARAHRLAAERAARSRLLGIVGQGPVAVPSVPGAAGGPRMAPIVGGDLTGEKLLGGPPPVIEIPVKPMTEGFATALAEQLAMEAERAQETVEYSFATFGSSVTASLAESLGEGIGTGFRGMGDILLKSLGSIFSRMGQQLIAYGVTMLKLLPALSNPFTSGPAAIAAGAALVALGAALGGIATGSGGAGGGAAGASPISEITAEQRTVNVSLHESAVQRASSVTPVQPIHFTVIGPDDPRAQRTIAEMVDNARARNL